ncbi:hypothetical protein ACFQ7N_38750 [Streptomyces niveus]|uniref:hypothetical protein n=1 Tax=Streptomyces niveus TaxID=193462 RepID=UPI0036A0C825
MNDDDIARGVSRALRDQERRQAEGSAHSVLAGVAILAILLVGFIVLVSYG